MVGLDRGSLILHSNYLIRNSNFGDFLRLTKLNPQPGLVKLSRFIGVFISEIKTPPCKTTLEK
jgi:hypothetical protein